MPDTADNMDEIDYGDPVPEARPEGVPDLTNPVTQRATATRAKTAARERAEALRLLLSTKSGRSFYAFILHDLAGLYRPVANAAFCPNALHFREGQRAVGQLLHNLALQEARQNYILMLSENLSNS
jgi:hypothetical protein